MSNWKKIENPEASRTYRREAIAVAFDFAPRIYPCATCGHPVASGYCCMTCGSGNPREPED